MAIELNEHKFLQEGVHEATLPELQERFGSFQRSDRRIALFRKLEEFVSALQQAEIGVEILVDGSFVMGAVDEPSDIDVVLVLPVDWDFAADLRPSQYNLVSRRMTKRLYRFDVVTVRKGSTQEDKWTAFFCNVNPKWHEPLGIPRGSRKGLVRVLI